MTVLFVFLTTLISAFVQATTGFGFGILFMAIAPYFLPYNVAQVLSISTSPLGNIANISKRLKKINIKQTLIPLFFSTITVTLSIEISKSIDMSNLRRILGVVLFILAFWFLYFSKKVKIKPSFRNCVIFGLLSGIGGGFFSMSGPPIVLYYLSALDDKEEYMATIQSYFLLNSLSTIIIRIFMGAFPSFSIFYYIASILGLICGSIIGSKFYSKLNGDMVKKCVYGFLALSGFWIVIGG